MSNNDGTSALAILPNPRDTAKLATVMRQALMEMRIDLLKPGVDYGKIPGTSKDVLLKPGAEKLSSGFKLYPVPKLLTCVEDWKDGFFFYRYQIDLVHRETGEVWGTGIGSCNSREKKYAWRWVTESELPAGLDKDTLLSENGTQTLTEFDFAVKKAETTGQYAKSAEYWQMFADAIEAGTAKKIQKETKRGMSDAWQITTGATRYRIPNPEICDLVNTIDKIAFKRAYVASVLIATNASEFFTQDLEDFAALALPDEDNVVEGHIEDVTPEPQEKKPEPHFTEDNQNRTVLVNAAIKAGYLNSGQGWADYLRLAELTDEAVLKFATGNDLSKHVKDKAEALKGQLAAAQISEDQARAALGNGGDRRIPPKAKTPEPEITDPNFKLATGGKSPFEAPAPVKPGTPEEDDGRHIPTDEEIDAQFNRAMALDN